MVEVYKAEGKRAGGKRGERLSVAKLREMVGEVGSDSLLTSYRSFPVHINFETQEDEEVVILFMRQHPVVNLSWIALCIFLLLLPPLFEFFPPYAALPSAYQLVMSMIFYLFVAGLALSRFMAWFFNIYIVTDERVVDVDFINLFYRVISTAKIEEIQDLSVVQSGVWETFFNYGKVEIQTAAEVTQFEFAAVPRPDKVGKILNQMIDQEEQEKMEGRVK